MFTPLNINKLIKNLPTPAVTKTQEEVDAEILAMKIAQAEARADEAEKEKYK